MGFHYEIGIKDYNALGFGIPILITITYISRIHVGEQKQCPPFLKKNNNLKVIFSYSLHEMFPLSWIFFVTAMKM